MWAEEWPSGQAGGSAAGQLRCVAAALDACVGACAGLEGWGCRRCVAEPGRPGLARPWPGPASSASCRRGHKGQLRAAAAALRPHKRSARRAPGQGAGPGSGLGRGQRQKINLQLGPRSREEQQLLGERDSCQGPAGPGPRERLPAARGQAEMGCGAAMVPWQGAQGLAQAGPRSCGCPRIPASVPGRLGHWGFLPRRAGLGWGC